MLFGGQSQEDDTVVATLAAALRRDISFGVLAPDEKLKIDGLRKRYGGSNHSMRETLRMLVAEGMVEATSQRGFRVTSATEADQRDITLMRVANETLGLSRAMALGGVEWEAGVIAAQHRLAHAEAQVQDSPDDVTALEWDEACRGLTMALLAACDSPRLIEIVGRFFNQSRRFRLARLREGRLDFAARAARQTALRQAVIARDTDRAMRVLNEDIRDDLGP